MMMRVAGKIVLILVFCLSAVVTQADDLREKGYSSESAEYRYAQYDPSIHFFRPRRSLVGKFGFSVVTEFNSQYMWRGIPSSQGAVWQPSFSLEYDGLGFSVWGNFVLDKGPNQGEFNEIDFTLYYHRNFKRLHVRTWVYTALYPNGNPQSLDDGQSSLEWDLKLLYELGPIEVFSRVGVRLISAPGAVWWTMGLGYTKKLPLKFSFQISSLFGLGNDRFNVAHFGVDGTKVNLFQWNLEFPWQPIKGFRITPNMHVSTLLANSLRRVAASPTNVWGGVRFDYSL